MRKDHNRHTDNGHSHHHTHEHGVGHNHNHAEHLHSHLHGNGTGQHAEELQDLAGSFLDGFRAAKDKTSYLRLAGVPFKVEGNDGLALHLVDAAIQSNWQIGTASPAFASRELAYMPFPGKLVQHRETMTFTYVSLTERQDIDLLTFLQDRLMNNDGEEQHEH